MTRRGEKELDSGLRVFFFGYGHGKILGLEALDMYTVADLCEFQLCVAEVSSDLLTNDPTIQHS